jgi:hypothetical protein
MQKTNRLVAMTASADRLGLSLRSTHRLWAYVKSLSAPGPGAGLKRFLGTLSGIPCAIGSMASH